MSMPFFLTSLSLVAFNALMAQEVTLDQQANTAAENSLLQITDGYRDARRVLTDAIGRVSDPTRQKLLRDALAANDAAWERVIVSEASLQQAARNDTERPDIRIRRLIEAEYASERTRKLKDWTAAILRSENK